MNHHKIAKIYVSYILSPLFLKLAIFNSLISTVKSFVVGVSCIITSVELANQTYFLHFHRLVNSGT
jgi:chaperone required for assembly of F1-ATPase